MLIIRDSQRARMRAQVLHTFKENMREHIRDFAPERIKAAGDDALEIFVDSRVDAAIERGLTLRGPVRLWLELSVVLGAAFETDPQHQPLMPDLDSARWPMPFSQRLYANTGRYLDACFGSDRAILGRVIDTVLHRELPQSGDPAEFLVNTVTHVWPERIAFSGEAPILALADVSSAAASAVGLETPRGRLLSATLSLCFGAGVMADPLYPFLHTRLAEDVPEPERIERALAGLRTYAATVRKR